MTVPASARVTGSRYAVLTGVSALVLAALPQPASSPVADLFAPAHAMRSLLGYRVAEIALPKDRK